VNESRVNVARQKLDQKSALRTQVDLLYANKTEDKAHGLALEQALYHKNHQELAA